MLVPGLGMDCFLFAEKVVGPRYLSRQTSTSVFFCGQGRIVSTRSFPKRSRRVWILTPTSGDSVHTCCRASLKWLHRSTNLPITDDGGVLTADGRVSWCVQCGNKGWVLSVLLWFLKEEEGSCHVSEECGM